MTAVLVEALLEVTTLITENRRRMGKAGATIGFICMTAAHLDKDGAAVDHLTVHEREWAYCPSNVRAAGHDWKATGGVTLGEVQTVVRARRERGAADARAKRR